MPSALVNPTSTVGLAAYNGDLYLAWTGQSSPYKVWYSAFNGTSWTAQASIPSTSSAGFAYSGTPLAAYQGTLYASWVTGTSELEYATFNNAPTRLPCAHGADIP